MTSAGTGISKGAGLQPEAARTTSERAELPGYDAHTDAVQSYGWKRSCRRGGLQGRSIECWYKPYDDYVSYLCCVRPAEVNAIGDPRDERQRVRMTDCRPRMPKPWTRLTCEALALPPRPPFFSLFMPGSSLVTDSLDLA
jgi:hypothetical protein